MDKTLLAAALWLCCHAFEAQAQPDSLRSGRVAIRGVEVTASARSADAAALSPSHTISRRMADDMGAADVGDALRHLAGVAVKDYAGVGGLKTVSVRGLGAEHTAVSYDGVAVGDCQSGQVDLSRFRMANVSELNLSIGQQGDILRPARDYASAATLDISTLPPRLDGRRVEAVANVVAGSYGLLNPSALLSAGLGLGSMMSFYADFLRADGNYPFHLMNGNKAIGQRRNNSDIRQLRSEANYYWQPRDGRRQLAAKAYVFVSERGLPGSVVYDNPLAFERLADRNAFGQIRYAADLTDKVRMKAAAKFNWSWQRDRNRTAAGPTEDRFVQSEAYLTAAVAWSPLQTVSVALSQDLARNHLTTTLRTNQHPSRLSSLTAVAASWTLRGFRATASALATNVSETVETGSAAAPLRRLSPAVAVSWQPGWGRGLRLRASYKDIFRVPTFNDLYYLLIGNANLRPEKTRQWNAGATWTGRISRLNATLTATADGYIGTVKDKIVAVPTMFVWKMSNLGRARMLGFDASVDMQAGLGGGFAVGLSASYGYLSATDRTDRSKAYYGHQIAYTPRHSASATATLRTPLADVSYNLVLASERFTSGYNAPENRIRPFADHSATVSRAFRIGKSLLRLRVEALNIGGKNYEVVRFYPMPGRNFRAVAEWRF